MFKKFTRQILLIGFYALYCIPLTHAAGPGIGVTLLDYTLDSANIDLGYTITIYAQVTNFDSLPFNGNINFGLRNSRQVLTSDNIFNTPPFSGDSISLPGHGSVPAIFSVNVSPQYFLPGPDVVVVWPICNLPIADTVLIHLNIIDPSSSSSQRALPFSYSILSDRILLKGLSPQTVFKQVRIFNAIGQLMVKLQSDSISEIQLPDLAQGIYLCELITSDGKRNTIRFFH